MRLLFLIAALLAWYPNTRVRTVTIVAPILTFIQLPLATVGKWVGGLHVLNAILILGMYIWLSYRLRHEQPAAQLHHALRERPHLREGRIRLGGSEVALHGRTLCCAACLRTRSRSTPTGRS